MTEADLKTATREQLLAEVKRLRATKTTTLPAASKRAIALAKDYDLFNDLRASKPAISRVAWKTSHVKANPNLHEQAIAFEKSFVATENRLIEEYQDA